MLIRLHLDEAEAHLALLQPQASKESLSAALALDPGQVMVLRKLAELSLAEEDHRGAADALIRMARIQKDPNELRWVFFKLGEIYSQHSPDPQRAEAAFQRVLKIAPNDVEAMESLVRLYERTDQPEAALQWLSALRERGPAGMEGHPHRLKLAEALEQARRHASGRRRTWKAFAETIRPRWPIFVHSLISTGGAKHPRRCRCI